MRELFHQFGLLDFRENSNAKYFKIEYLSWYNYYSLQTFIRHFTVELDHERLKFLAPCYRVLVRS